MHVLRIAAFLQPGIMLLEGVAVHRIVQKESEVRVQIEQRPAEKAIRLECVAIRPSFAVVARERAELDASAVGGIDVAEAVEQAGVHQIERNLAGRIEIVPPEDEAEPELLRRRSAMSCSCALTLSRR